MARLRADAERRSYASMTNASVLPYSRSSIHPTTSPAHAFTSTANYMQSSQLGVEEEDGVGTTAEALADIDKQLSVVINILVSVFACGAAIWVVARWWATGPRLAVSLLGAGGVGIAETVVYWGYIRKVSEAKRKEKVMKEKKEVLATHVVGSDSTTQSNGNGDSRKETDFLNVDGVCRHSDIPGLRARKLRKGA